MRIIGVTIVFLVVAISANANERIYKKLNKLYLSNPTLCLEKSKKYMDKKPSEGASYFFASSIYFDKVDQSHTLRGKYLQLRRAINYARKFDKIGTIELKEKVLWTDKLEEIQDKTTRLITALDKNHQEDLSQELIANIRKIESLEELKATPIIQEVEITSTPTNTASKPEFVKLENQFYGMPTGTEVVASANPENEQKMLDRINKERVSKGLPPLTWNEDLAKASRYHAYDLGTQAYFDHKSCDRINDELIEVGATFDRIRKFYTATHVNSENIAAGHESVDMTYMQWYNSKSHHKNLFNPDSRYVGIGICYIPNSPYGYYWVMSTAE